MKIDETWKSHKICEFLIERILPQEKQAAMLKVCIRNGRIVIVAKVSFLTLANAWVLCKCFAEGFAELEAWNNKPEDEKMSEMNSINSTRRKNVTTTIYRPVVPLIGSKVIETPNLFQNLRTLMNMMILQGEI